MNYKKLTQKLAKGWNTYNNSSVLSHVLMPYGLSINLGLKVYSTGSVLKEALIGRFGEHDEKIHPGVRSYDGSYTELNIKYCGVEFMVQSATKNSEQYILVTPIVNTEIKAPALIVQANVLWNKDGYVKLCNNHIEGVFEDKVVKIYVSGDEYRDLNTGILSPYMLVSLNKPVAISTGKKSSVDKVLRILVQAKAKVIDGMEKYGELKETYNAMRTCMAWDTIYEPEKEMICTPVSRLWNISWGGYVLFCWDTYFSGMLAMIDNKELAYANVIAITREATESGFVPNFGAANDDKSRDRSQPPVGALAVKEIYRIYREKWIVEELFDELLKWNRWFESNRVIENGQLCWGSNPYELRANKHWETDGVDDTLGGALESGLDNSPMYDDIPFDKEKHIMKLADVGLTGLFIMDCEALIELASVIGRVDVIDELTKKAEKSKIGLSQMWDEKTGMYLNKRTDTGEFNYRISPTNFYALFSDSVTEYQAKRMIDEHFYNPDEFWGEYIMPTIARNDPAYPDQTYWRGRIWAPTNYLSYIAMRKQGLTDACKDYASKSKELLLKEWIEHGHVHENYCGDTGYGCGVNNSDKFYHWGALLSLISLIDNGFVSGPEQPL